MVGADFVGDLHLDRRPWGYERREADHMRPELLPLEWQRRLPVLLHMDLRGVSRQVDVDRATLAEDLRLELERLPQRQRG